MIFNLLAIIYFPSKWIIYLSCSEADKGVDFSFVLLLLFVFVLCFFLTFFLFYFFFWETFQVYRRNPFFSPPKFDFLVWCFLLGVFWLSVRFRVASSRCLSTPFCRLDISSLICWTSTGVSFEKALAVSFLETSPKSSVVGSSFPDASCVVLCK